MTTEVAHKADFTAVRYGQCWEDADILLAGLDIQPGDVCLSIASAGDNSLALLTRNPGRVIALDLNPAQIACLALRVAAYRELSHPELLEFIGCHDSQRREALYQRCRSQLESSVRSFWDSQPNAVRQGIGSCGKFEHYFQLFRRWILPLVHAQPMIDRVLKGGTREERAAFYKMQWDCWQWRLLFRAFFSRFVMGRLGRDPSFFAYVEGNVACRILARVEHALTELNPQENPYLQWILTGHHITALPLALRREHFETIRSRLDRLEWHCQSLEDFTHRSSAGPIDRYNLSNIFEYMSEESYYRLLDQLVRNSRVGTRLVYWNMLVPRTRPESMAERLLAHNELSARLLRQDKAFFYSRFVVEEVRSPC